MPTFNFEAMDSAGGKVEVSVEAATEKEAGRKIRQMGYSVIRLTEVAAKKKKKKKDKRKKTPLLGKWLTTVTGPFRFLTRLFKKPAAKSPPEAGEAKPAPEEKAGGQKPMPKSAPVRQARRIGQVLIDFGFIDEDHLGDILEEAKNTSRLTGQVALSRGLITEDQLLEALADQHNLQVISLDDVKPTAEALQVVPEAMASAYKILPLSYRDGILAVVSSDPSNLTALDDLRNVLGCKEVRAQIASAKAIADAQARAYTSIPGLIYQMEQNKDLGSRVGGRGETSIDIGHLMEIKDIPPVHKLVNMVMLMAIRDKASDIHFEEFEAEYKMRYRCDGILYEMVPPPRHLGPAIADRIKGMANLDTAERRLPQYGRIDLEVGGNPLPMRVSVLPTMFGESVAIRVLDRTVVGQDLNRVGMDPVLLTQFRELIHKPNGIVLVTGPTGAGKTATLYSALNELNEIADKIVIAEDPIEYEIDGIVRCRIHDLTSANALRSILGQDPDIIVVGAIHDRETAQIAMQAALSGRLVLSTLDANDAASSITRLRGMGMEPSSIAATVKGILGQRLVRKICEHCRMEFEPAAEQMKELNLRPADVKGKKFYYGQRCERCNNNGYRGRCGIFELIIMNDELRDLISGGASTDQLRTACWGQGMSTLREAGLKAIFNGVTTIDDVAQETVLV